MKKVLISLISIGAVAVLAFGASRAFFSDTETSTGNIFQAGAIDLEIDNESWYNGVYQTGMSWEYGDLMGLFFNYNDLKPGDWGEDTISIHVHDNDAYLCADITLTGNNENDVTEPESELNDTGPDGELPEELNFVFWADDGDNVLEEDEATNVVYGNLGDAWLNQSHTFALADSQFNAWSGTGPITGGQDYFLGKAWCFGDLALKPVPGEGGVNPGINPGVLCNGAPVTNISQTDSATLDVSFTAVQSRNNPGFVCQSNYVGDRVFLKLENKTAGYIPITNDGIYGKLWFKTPYPTFDYDLEVYGLQPNTDYHLHYYADPWPSTLGIAIATFTTNVSGNWSGSGSVELNTDLPVAGDANSPNAKIWVIPTSHWGGTGTGMTNWIQTLYLWEWNLVQYDDTDI